MKTPPTAAEIDAEIAKLKEMKPSVLPRSAFGDNHHRAIDAQIDVLKDQMEEDDAYDQYEDDPDNIRDAAIQACQWLTGEEEQPPSEEWKELVRK